MGLSEADATDRNRPFHVTRLPFSDVDRAVTDHQTEGFVKVLTKPGSDTILGVTIVGPHAGDLLGPYILAMRQGLGLRSILGCIFPYPTYGEAAKRAAGLWQKDAVPKWGLPLLALWHKIRRRM